MNLLKNPALCFIDCFLFFSFKFHWFLFWSSLFPLFSLGLFCSFSRFQRKELRLLIWDFSSFLMYAFSAMNFPLDVLAMSHKFSYFWNFSFCSLYFLISLKTCFTHGLFRIVLFSLQAFSDFPVIDFYFDLTVLENTIYMISIILDLLRFVFIAHEMVYLGIYSTVTQKDSVLCCYWEKFPLNIIYPHGWECCILLCACWFFGILSIFEMGMKVLAPYLAFPDIILAESLGCPIIAWWGWKSRLPTLALLVGGEGTEYFIWCLSRIDLLMSKSLCLARMPFWLEKAAFCWGFFWSMSVAVSA